MQQINCLNLCEILSYLEKKRSMQEILKEAMKLAQYNSCKRLYVGSSFCGKYFLQQSDKTLIELSELCCHEDIKVTLVLPTFSEGDLESGKRKIGQIIECCKDAIDEITVNDFGMLPYVKENYNKAVNLGRLFMKDYRDPRYTEYFQIPVKPKMFTTYLNNVLKEYGVNSCEFDLTHKIIDFSEVPKGIIPGLHVPYCYQTVGRICEYASISKEIAKKFRPNDYCDEKCIENYIEYSLPDENLKYIRFGRTIYFKHPGYELRGLGDYRLIYFPVEL